MVFRMLGLQSVNFIFC